MKPELVCSIAEKDFLTAEEVQVYLDIKPTTLQKWKHEGLKYIKVGESRTNKVLFSKEHIKEFLMKWVQ